MSDTSQGPGWWLASDGRWYAPELHPDYRSPQVEGDAQPPLEPSSLGPGSSGPITVPAASARDMVVAAADKWRRQLIDLGGRNNLLYYKDRKTGSLDLSPEAGADEVVVGRLLTLGKARLSELYGLDRELLATAAKRARGTAKKATENLEERGLSTLHLAWGFATWAGDRSSSAPCAPILMRQAVLASRGGAADDFDLGLEGEWTINPTLPHALRTDFKAEIDPEQLDDLIGTAEAGDPVPLFERISKLAADVPAFVIRPGVTISNFFYANLALVEDLSNSLDLMVSSSLICAIVGDEEARDELRDQQIGYEIADPDDVPPADEFLVLDADASQSYVINAGVAGLDLVVQGPPGTGKSQTIANLIASLSARGIKTLFVAEKRAAIEAVVKRLNKVGLGDLVLDLHESTGTRAKVIAELDRSLHSASSTPFIDYSAGHQDLERRRAELVERAKTLATAQQPWGISISDIYCELPGFEDQVRLECRISGTRLEDMVPTVLLEYQDDVERFVILGGLPLIDGASFWSNALTNGTITTVAEVQNLRNTIRQVLSADLPDTGLLLQQVLQECGLVEPLTVKAWSDLFVLLDDVAETLRFCDHRIYQLPLDRLLRDLAPAKKSLLARSWSAISNGSYRQAKKAMQDSYLPAKGSVSTLYDVVDAARDQLVRWQRNSSDGGFPRLPSDIAESESAYRHLFDDLRAVGALVAQPNIDDQSQAALFLQLDAMLKDGGVLDRLPELHRLYQRMAGAGLLAILTEIADRNLSAEQAVSCLRFVWLSSVLESVTAQDSKIAAFDGAMHRTVIRRYREADLSHIANNPQRINRLVAERVTQARNDFPREAELLAKQAKLKRKHMTIRQLRHETPNVLAALKPCWAMSPLMVAQLLPSENCFDLCIFDEASQVTPAGAVSTLIRADQAIVAGDPKQLPPTSFFASTAGDDEEDSDVEDVSMSLVEGMESVLDVMGALLPPPNGTKTLNWHYRSRDERLIAFSNAQQSLYDWSLTTFPGTSVGSAVSHILVPFQPGMQEKTSTSTAEVREVVELVRRHCRTHPEESLGVIGFGIEHANRIEEGLRLARADDPSLDRYMDEWAVKEPLFVKNLERVQGDERDAIVISVGYGKSPDGRLYYRFGPINNAGGERRLNVAATRARMRMTVVSSFSSQDMDPTKLNSEGPQMLQRFLAYAESEGSDLGPHARREVDLNPFERDVRDQLSAAGIPIIPQYGCSGYWIDFAAQHPTQPGKMVLAIEADGASYHSQQSARNRDRLRQEHLERLGWHFHRIWSQDWFLHREQEIERALEAYRQAVDRADNNGPTRTSTSDSFVVEHQPTTSADGSVNTVPQREGSIPVPRHLPIDEYSDRQLVALIRWIESDTLLRTDEELREEAIQALGYLRRGHRIVERINRAIQMAHRSRSSD